ncbi:phage integrase central domain-containing protein [Pseudoxanthomonas mexicana]|uniref:tyrosine-type recombinase/integrase n=1 Tax=Pseudoxanthomonas mexicana TaxID=128785 RepID=UPI0028A8005C|nr:integrase arm-type DNA-binding domain-containing protein [Pseudoxanthomonas mexicana]
MPRKARELKALEVARLTEQGFHSVGGVAGLHLRINEAGARNWILRAMVGGKRRDIGLGGFPDVPLAQARDKARTTREKIGQGVDPVLERRSARQALLTAVTFDEAAARFIEAKSPEWSNPKHRAQWKATLDTYASPRIGSLPVDRVELPHILEILSPIWTTKTETASRVRMRVESVLAWATASGYRSGDNPARWKGNLDVLLAKPSKVKKVEHHAALAIDALPAFVANLRGRDGVAARALEFLILTATRSGEVRGATWDEFDLKSGVWIIPGERMKAGKEHRVPLCARALALVKEQPQVAGSSYVFSAPRGGQLSDMTLSAVMRRMEVDAVPHGFRSTFRDWCSERTAYPRDVAEMALAHTIQNKTEAAYRRGDLYDKRVNMMKDWQRFIDTPAKNANVVSLRRATK